MARLTYVDDTMPGITRRPVKGGAAKGTAGRGIAWAYHGPDGKRITDRDEIDRLNAIALPPAYEQAWFCPRPNGHIQATGVDARGRKQYRYHTDFRASREEEKFGLCAAFGHALPKLRERLTADLSGRKLDRDRTLAAVVRLLDLGALRVGNERYAKENKSFGATTLRRRHAKLSGATLSLRFKSKSGQLREVNVTDRALATTVRRMEDLPGQHLFQFVDEAGEAHPVGSSDVNAYIKNAMGEDFTAKHFRTWTASTHAYQLLAEAEEPLKLTAMLQAVSAALGNTPAIARKSYIHPALLDLAKEGQADWRETLKLPRETQWLSRYERGLVQMLEAR